jgi:hypothetical protein
MGKGVALPRGVCHEGCDTLSYSDTMFELAGFHNLAGAYYITELLEQTWHPSLEVVWTCRKSADGIAALQLHLDHPNRYLSGIEPSPGPLGKGFPTLHLSPLPVVEFSQV